MTAKEAGAGAGEHRQLRCGRRQDLRGNSQLALIRDDGEVNRATVE